MTNPGYLPPVQQPAFIPGDKKELFYRHFQQECTDLQEQIDKLEDYSLVGGEKQDAIDHVLTWISRLSNEVQDSSEFIPAYDQRIYSQAIKALEEKLQETRAKVAPKARFQFKTKQKNDSAVSISDAAALAAQQRLGPPTVSPATSPASLRTPPGELRDTLGELPLLPKNYNDEMNRQAGPIRKPSFSQSTNVNISDHHCLHIILPSSASRATASGTLSELTECIVDMSVPTASGAPFAGITLKNIKRSLIVAGHVAGSAHITGVEDSIIVVASRQVRMHDCKNVDIYLHCGSRPIIEDCSNVRFSPIPNNYMIAVEEKSQNHWDQVDDFKWLKSEHSPNWSILPEGKRLPEDIWVNTVPGGPGVGIYDIFKKVGLKRLV